MMTPKAYQGQRSVLGVTGVRKGVGGLQNELILPSSRLGQIPLSFQLFDYLTQTLDRVQVKRPHKLSPVVTIPQGYLELQFPPTVCAIKYLFENVKIQSTGYLWAIDINQTLFSSSYFFKLNLLGLYRFRLIRLYRFTYIFL